MRKFSIEIVFVKGERLYVDFDSEEDMNIAFQKLVEATVHGYCLFYNALVNIEYVLFAKKSIRS